MSARFPGLYFHERLEVALVTHVDDLLCSGSEENLNWVRAELSKKYEVKGQVMAEGNTEIKFLASGGTSVASIGKKTPSIGMSCWKTGVWCIVMEFHSCGNNRAMRGRQGEYARFRCNHVPNECRPIELPGAGSA